MFMFVLPLISTEYKTWNHLYIRKCNQKCYPEPSSHCPTLWSSDWTTEIVCNRQNPSWLPGINWIYRLVLYSAVCHILFAKVFPFQFFTPSTHFFPSSLFKRIKQALYTVLICCLLGHHQLSWKHAHLKVLTMNYFSRKCTVRFFLLLFFYHEM